MSAPASVASHADCLVPDATTQREKRVSIIPPVAPAYYEGKEHDYCYQFVPVDAQRVLEIGCGAGELGRRLKERGVKEVVGLERDPDAAARARAHLDYVHTANIEEFVLDYPAGYFDCLICSGVLEHLQDPWHTLYTHREMVRDGGTLVVLLPNVQHYSLLLHLLQGHWSYSAEGLLDATHYRFFTRAEVITMFLQTGFHPTDMMGVTLGDLPPDAGRLREALAQTGLASADTLHDLQVYVWVGRATKLPHWSPAPRPAPGTSTLVPHSTPMPQGAAL